MARALLIMGDQTALRYGARDIELMREFCDKLCISASSIQGGLLKVNNAILSFMEKTIDDETLVVYFTGHVIIQKGKACLRLGAGDSIVDLLPLSLLVEMLSNANSRNVVLILDCCSAGAAIRELKNPGRENCTLFLASETLGPVKEDEVLGASVFTYHLHEVVVTNARDLVKNGYYSLFKLRDAVMASVARANAIQDNPAPLPAFSSLVGHDIRLGNASACREEEAGLSRLTREYVVKFIRCAESCEKWCQDSASWCNTVVKSDINMNRFAVPSVREYRSETVQRVRLDAFVNQWLSEPKWYLGILGEMGIGKTSACLYIFYQLCKSFDDKRGLVPVYIPLSGDLVQRLGKGGVFEVISDCMGGGFKPSDVKRLVKERRLVMLLDGFDEIGKDQSTSAILRNYDLLKSVFRLENRTILTCRTHFFAEQDQLEEVLTGRVPGTDLSIAVLDSDEHPFNMVEVLELTEDEIVTLIGMLSDEQDARAIWRKICSVYDLRDLAKRAILLKMIVRVWPEIEGTESTVTSASLYTRYTRALLHREATERRAGVEIDSKERFIGCVASLMYRRGTLVVSGEELDREVRQHFGVTPADRDTFNNVNYDCKVATFFSRDRSDCYRFMHKSFYEYYFARHCLEEVLDGTFDGWDIEWFPREVAKFVSELTLEPRYRRCVQPLLHKSLSETDGVTRWNAIHIISLLNVEDIALLLDEGMRHSFVEMAWSEKDIVLVRQYCRVISKFIDRREAEKLIDEIIEVARRDHEQDAENDRTYTNYYGGENAACMAFVRHLTTPSPKYDAKLHLYMLEHMAQSRFADAILDATEGWENREAYMVEIDRAVSEIRKRASGPNPAD